ncbi:MAG TPA: kelch repeat-containing protein [Candidatus Limnocylindria bacterium]
MPAVGRRAPLITVAVLLVACASPVPDPSPSAPASTSANASAAPSAAASATAGESTASASWEREADAPFARLEMAVAAHGGRFWLAGGLSPFGEALTDVAVLDPSTGEWSDGPVLPAAVHHAALVSDGDRLLLIGGYLGPAFNRPTEIVLVLTDGDDAWHPGPSLPAARAAGAAAWDGSRVLYAGGVGDGVVADIYALADDAWERIGAMREPREHFAATSDLEGRTWLLGGRVGGLTSNLGTVELVEGGTVTLLGVLPTPRGGVAAFFVPGLGACLSGGEAPDRAYTAVECMAADGTVTQLPDLLEPHHGHGTGVVGGIVYTLLGGPEPTLSAGSTVESLALDRLGR